MKKIWLALAGMILAFSATAAQFTDGKQYITLTSLLLASLRCWSSSPSTARIAISLRKFFMYQIT